MAAVHILQGYLDKKQNKKYRGYINALEALNIRLEENKEQEKTEEIAQES